MKIQKFKKWFIPSFISAQCCIYFVEHAIFCWNILSPRFYQYEFMVTYFDLHIRNFADETHIYCRLDFIFSWLLSGAFDKCFIIIVLFTINMPSNILGFLPLSNIFELLIVEEIWRFNICHLYSIVKQNILYCIHNATLVCKLSLNNWYCFVVIIVNVSLVFLITAF